MRQEFNPKNKDLQISIIGKPFHRDEAGISPFDSVVQGGDGIRRIPPDCVDQNIHSCNLINSILAKIHANATDVDDALILDYQGFVAETNATHIFIVHDGVVMTSKADSCPEGITRATILEICEANNIPFEVKDISLTEVYRADEMFCTGTMGELAPVVELDGRVIGDGQLGDMTRRMSDLFRERTKVEGYQVVEYSS